MRLLLSLCLLLVMLFASMLIGSGNVPFVDALAALGNQGSETARFVVWELRFSRTLMALVVGVCLAVAGALMQTLTKNPLAEPGLMGVSAGSAFAIGLAILFGAGAADLSVWPAQIGALVGCLLVIWISQTQNLANDPVRLVLTGATLSALLLSSTAIILMLDDRVADEIRFWIMGSVAGRNVNTLYHVMPSLVIAGLIVAVFIRPLASIGLGETVAVGLGHNPNKIRMVIIIAVALLVGAATAVAGPLIFVGLVVPFTARAIAGTDIRRYLWQCLLLGPCLLVFADIICRVIVPPSELPVGVLTTLIGAPVLLFLVHTKRIPRL
ncbi:FecCD family ABC transporter permease [Marinibactrum halimedae]|uniref:Iron-enterobactin transporter membrane protein n=1 Tax=Marinibactrum halimedae TaxID=1444977 RepID=A0AA37T5T0_9GAMM|nr:iron ABC transporter permease [Marinibactrum halimedae]MCD9457963.1 iron ABC transporter permease [Marinibactrum halimedae]GLS26206.1 iron-enterobactin transporter membrane protein [Marinibactrum halimedae]